MKGLVPKTKLFFKRNGSTILTCAGAFGVIATAVAAVKATPKATKLLEMAKEEKGEKLTKAETVKIAGPAYIPSILIGTATISCIFGANALNKRQQAALVGLYSLVDSSYKEYKDKVKETYGEDADEKVRNAIAKDHCPKDVTKTTPEKQIFMEFNSLQVFESTLDKVREAEKVINELLKTRGYVMLNEYYETLGIPCIPDDFDRGWGMTYLKLHGYDHIEIEYAKSAFTTTIDDQECYLITTTIEPTSDYLF